MPEKDIQPKEEKKSAAPHEAKKKPAKKAAPKSPKKSLSDADILKERIVALEAEVNGYKDALLREQAELVNFKRRLTDEKIKDRQYANSGLLKSLLPLIDHLDAALKMEGAKEAFKPFLPNFEKLNENALTVLKDHGLEPVEALNKPFDPALHEAVMKESKDGVDPGIVIEVFQKGYRYHDRLLRPAMVKVSE